MHRFNKKKKKRKRNVSAISRGDIQNGENMASKSRGGGGELVAKRRIFPPSALSGTLLSLI